MDVYPEGGEAQFRLLTELDKITTCKTRALLPWKAKLGFSHDPEFRRVTSESSPLQRYFRHAEGFPECAMRLHLFPYVQEWIRQTSSPGSRRWQSTLNRLLDITVEVMYSRRSSQWRSRCVEMIRLLLESGANPNANPNAKEADFSQTVWQRVANCHRRGPLSEEDCVIKNLFLQYGAAPDADDTYYEKPKSKSFPKSRQSHKGGWSTFLRLRK